MHKVSYPGFEQLCISLCEYWLMVVVVVVFVANHWAFVVSLDCHFISNFDLRSLFDLCRFHY